MSNVYGLIFPEWMQTQPLMVVVVPPFSVHILHVREVHPIICLGSCDCPGFWWWQLAGEFFPTNASVLFVYWRCFFLCQRWSESKLWKRQHDGSALIYIGTIEHDGGVSGGILNKRFSLAVVIDSSFGRGECQRADGGDEKYRAKLLMYCVSYDLLAFEILNN